MWTNRLTANQAQQVLALAERAAASDGTMPLNEEAHFALADGSARHLLDQDGDDLRGYLHWHPGYRTAQLVVDPDARRRGIGRQLVGALRDAVEIPDQVRDDTSTGAAGWGIWAFGDLPAAQGFASALGLVVARGLLVMSRSLRGIDALTTRAGLTLRGFRPDDATELIAVNAAAFAHHPEQGALDPAGLAARMAEPWFDPQGLILGFDDEGLAGFHWTKRLGSEGEVYVIGVAPRTQGRGYGKVLLQAGLAHLRDTGADHVVLYVDMAEPVAVRMYERAGFHVAHRDVLYAPEHGGVQEREQP